MKPLLFIFSMLLIQCSGKVSNNSVDTITTNGSKEEVSSSKEIAKTQNEEEVTNTNCFNMLVDAIKKVDSLMVIEILKDGCDVNQKVAVGKNYYSNDSIYSTALSVSIDHGMTSNYEIVKLLLKSKADPNIELGDRSPLERVIVIHKNDIVKELIKYGADVNHFNKYTTVQSPLMVAIISGNFEALKILIENGAKFRPYEENIHHPLHAAIESQRVDIAEFLIEEGVNTRTKITPVNFEGEFGDCFPCPYEIEPLHSAVQLDDPELAIQFIDLLLANKADINAMSKQGYTPLSYIAVNGSALVGKHLISKGAIVDNVAIETAAGYQNNEYLKVLLSNGKNIDVNSEVLSEAIFCCGDSFNEALVERRIETVNILLEYGAKPTEALSNKVSRQEHLKPILKILKEHGK